MGQHALDDWEKFWELEARIARGFSLGAEHALELEVREKKKDSKKGIFFLRRLLARRKVIHQPAAA